MKERTYKIPVAKTDDCWETLEKWMKKNRYKKQVKVIVRGVCEEIYFLKGDHKYFISGQLFIESEDMFEFSIARLY